MKTFTSLFSFLLFMLFSFQSHAQVDYEEEIQPIFNQNCTSCHGSNSGVNLSSYDEVMNSVGNQYGTEIVVPNEPDESPLVDKIEPNPQFGVRMPQGGPSLSDEQISLIRTWIEEGANEVAVSNQFTESIPNGFKLESNYPNPFNPQTIVSFQTPEYAQYRLEVYNLGGVLVQTINGMTDQRTTDVAVNLQNQPSGVYMYRVKILMNDKSFWLGTQKMTLVK